MANEEKSHYSTDSSLINEEIQQDFSLQANEINEILLHEESVVEYEKVEEVNEKSPLNVITQESKDNFHEIDSSSERSNSLLVDNIQPSKNDKNISGNEASELDLKKLKDYENTDYKFDQMIGEAVEQAFQPLQKKFPHKSDESVFEGEQRCCLVNQNGVALGNCVDKEPNEMLQSDDITSVKVLFEKNIFDPPEKFDILIGSQIMHITDQSSKEMLLKYLRELNIEKQNLEDSINSPYRTSSLSHTHTCLLRTHVRTQLLPVVVAAQDCQNPSHVQNYQNCMNESQKTIEDYKNEIHSLTDKLRASEDAVLKIKNEFQKTKEQLTEENICIRTDLTNRLELLMKKYESSNKNKEDMVMKYAFSENEVLKLKKLKDGLEKKIKDQNKDKEILQGKLNSLVIEKSKICNMLDKKVHENGLTSRELEKLREEINAKDIKIKWSQTKLRTEMDAHKETESRLEKALEKITKHEDDLSAMKKEAEKIVQNGKDNESSKANSLEVQIKEQKALLIMERQKCEDYCTVLKSTSNELESLKAAYSTLEQDTFALKDKVLKYEQERIESEKLFSSLQTEVANAKEGAADLSNQLINSNATADELEREQARSKELEIAKHDLQSLFEEQKTELSDCLTKEAELLAFTEKLTEQNVKLQSQLCNIEGKVRLLEIVKEESELEKNELKSELRTLKLDFNKSNATKNEEIERLKSELTAKTEEASNLKTKLSDLVNEIKVQQKKHQNASKDINREISKLRKKLEVYETKAANEMEEISQCSEDQQNYNNDASPHSGSSSCSTAAYETISQDSRALSNNSLNVIENASSNAVNKEGVFNEEALSASSLIERILKLQKNGMKKTEKIEFLEEHVAQLISELKKKSKIIHHYIMKEESGAVSSSKSDFTKAELIKKGGIMASVYDSTLKDGTMTFELSLEINKKLQAVLEDTLLKNITLKENLNTLGDEVANLSLQNSRLSSKKY